MTQRDAIEALKKAEALTGNQVAAGLIRQVRVWLEARKHK